MLLRLMNAARCQYAGDTANLFSRNKRHHAPAVIPEESHGYVPVAG